MLFAFRSVINPAYNIYNWEETFREKIIFSLQPIMSAVANRFIIELSHMEVVKNDILYIINIISRYTH